MKTLLGAIVLASLVVTRLFALQDTLENRAELADRLIRTFPVQDWWASAERMMQNVPKDQRDLLVSILRHMNWEVITQAMRQTMMEIYSADELQALIAVYSSPVGRAIMRNQGSYQSTEELKAAEGFFSSSIGQSIRRKQPIFISKMEPVYKREMLKAMAIAAQEASNGSQ
jgi:hypothetical protein